MSRTAQREVGRMAPTWRGLATNARRKRKRSVRVSLMPSSQAAWERRTL